MQSIKHTLLIVILLATGFSHAQTNLKLDSSFTFVKEKGIQLNTVVPPSGFRLYYNCDSLLFMRGDFGDTIRIWTSSTDWYQSLEQFKNTINNEDFGKTQFLKSIDNNGRLFVSTYDQTEFIYRNDSLYEIEDASPAPEGLVQLFEQYFKNQIDESTYKFRLDSLGQIEKTQAIYTPKLIFSKKMFQKSNKVKLSKKVNFKGDTIELEKQWVENGKNCYLVRINNKEDGEQTTYAFAINEDMKFVWWQGCNK